MRANRVFPAASQVKFVFDIESRKFAEISACPALKIIESEDYIPAVLKIDETKSVVESPFIATKEAEPEESFLVEEESVQEVIEEAELVIIEEVLPAPEPVVDVTPVVLSPDEPIPDVTELEVVEAVKDVVNVGVVSCPYCKYAASTQVGTYHHVRMKHPEKYTEYKKRVKKN
jgi:hypothetical protein